MNEKYVCEKCGAKMRSVQTPYSLGMECPNCGWGWISTYNEPIYEDENEYLVILESKESSFADVKTVSSIVNCNFIQAKKIIESAPVEIYCGDAIKVREIKEKLDQNNVAYRIEPKFPY